MKFAVIITLKKDVLDPQGKVIQQTLQSMNMFIGGLFDRLFELNDNLTEVLFNEPQAAKTYTSLYLTVNRQSRIKEAYNKYSRLFVLQITLLLNTTHQAANPQNHLIKVPKLLIFQIID